MPRRPSTGSDTGAYRVLSGFNYGQNDARVEAGDVVSDLPKSDIKWLLEAHIIEEAVGGSDISTR